MFDRLWWFVSGIFAGGFVTVRALRRKPRPADLRAAAAHTGADVLDLAARVVRPSGRSRKPVSGSTTPEAGSPDLATGVERAAERSWNVKRKT